jgi:alkanesulfonate monooxygenase SsuD/methylene tetrahydromethanopterin reductase-like flavin-dependent oxidoreductase (luciferase family)
MPRFGIFLPAMGLFAEPTRSAELAASAEESGWDGIFLWDHVLAFPEMPVADAWITLAAMAAATERIRLGPLVTPLARRRPWVLARQIATLDRLSKGRLTMGIGLGDDGWREFSAFGEEADPRRRAQVLNESLELLGALLSGHSVDHHGEHFDVESTAFLPTPLQHPVPAWGACIWPHAKPVARAARLQGIFPIFDTPIPPPPPTPPQISEILKAVEKVRGTVEGFDVVVRFPFGLEDPATLGSTLAGLEQAGATWILDSFGPDDPEPEVIESIVRNGPPR